MKNAILIFSILLLSVAINSCSDNCNATEPILEKSISEMFKEAIADAQVVNEDEIYTGLNPIIKSNQNLVWNGDYVLVVSLTKYNTSYPIGDTVITKWGETWVTVAPDLKNFFKTKVFDNDSLELLRYYQLLGLPYNSNQKYIIEFWVNPNDLFRPCPDPEITDTKAELYFPEGTDSTHIKWFNNNIIYSYYSSPIQSKYPWTRLGYTYDWANPNSKGEIGLSEYVLKTGSKIIVKSNQLAVDYNK